MQSVGEERNACRCLLNCLVQYGTNGKCPSVCCKALHMTFVSCRVMLIDLQLNSSVNDIQLVRQRREQHGSCLETQRVFALLWEKLC